MRMREIDREKTTDGQKMKRKKTVQIGQIQKHRCGLSVKDTADTSKQRKEGHKT